MNLRVVGIDLPGRVFCGPDGSPLADLQVGVQVRDQPEGLTPADADSARWDSEARTVIGDDGVVDFRGPAVHGRRGERFVYLTWGDVGGDGAFRMFRRAKLMLNRVDAELIHAALAPDRTLVATVRLTDERGGPRCARVDAPAITWTIS